MQFFKRELLLARASTDHYFLFFCHKILDYAIQECYAFQEYYALQEYHAFQDFLFLYKRELYKALLSNVKLLTGYKQTNFLFKSLLIIGSGCEKIAQNPVCKKLIKI